MQPPQRCLTLLLAAVPIRGRAIATSPRAVALGDLVPAPARESLQRINGQLQDAATALLRKLGGRADADAVEQPVFAGSWKTDRTENLDDFLDRAMGVGYLKRKIAAKASQSQRLYQQGQVVHLELTDRRGTMKYELYPDGRVVSGRGFMKLPIKQRCKWGKGGALLVEERYSIHLGGEDGGKPCSGSSCPVVHSCRSVNKSGQMLVEVERTLRNGETVRMKTFYVKERQKDSSEGRKAFVTPPRLRLPPRVLALPLPPMRP